MHFLVPCNKLVSYFTSIKKAVTIIINFENKVDKNALFVKFKKKIISFRNQFDTAIGLRVLDIVFLSLSHLKIFWEGHDARLP